MFIKNGGVKLFIAIFILILLYPDTRLFSEKRHRESVEGHENRRITEFPSASFLTKEYYSVLENWHNDRLERKYTLISYWCGLNYRLGINLSDNIVGGKNDELFDKNRIVEDFKDKEAKIALIKNLQEYCHQKNTKFIFMLAPNKEAIYSDLLPTNLQDKSYSFVNYNKELEAGLSQNNVSYLSLAELFFKEHLEHPDKDLYFKDDHHWSYDGAALAVDSLLSRIQNEVDKNFYLGLQLDATQTKAYKQRSYADAIGLFTDKTAKLAWSQKYNNEVYLLDCYTNEAKKLNKIIDYRDMAKEGQFGESIIENKGLKNNVTMLYLGDSYTGYMMPYLSQMVRKNIFTHYNNIGGKKESIDIPKLLDKYHPDVVVFEILGDHFFNSAKNGYLGNIVIK